MGFVVYLGQMLEIKVRIHLSCGDIGMSQQLLNATQVMTGFEQVGSEGVAEQVWVDIGINTLLSSPV